jgi:hypothetical protein
VSAFDWPQVGDPVTLADSTVATVHNIPLLDRPGEQRRGQIAGTSRPWVRLDCGGLGVLWLCSGAKSAYRARHDMKVCSHWREVPFAVDACEWVVEAEAAR